MSVLKEIKGFVNKDRYVRNAKLYVGQGNCGLNITLGKDDYFIFENKLGEGKCFNKLFNFSFLKIIIAKHFMSSDSSVHLYFLQCIVWTNCNQCHLPLEDLWKTHHKHYGSH